jgi:hypothetical protein
MKLQFEQFTYEFSLYDEDNPLHKSKGVVLAALTPKNCYKLAQKLESLWQR